MTYTAPDDPSAVARRSPAIGRGDGRRADAPEVAEPEVPASQTPVVKTEWEKTPRNAPCPCGSGKKFKQCHGAA